MATKWLSYQNSVEYDLSNSEAGLKFLEEYQLVNQIHHGPLRNVYIIKHKETQVLYILKTIDKNQCSCNVDLIKKINHPNIVKVYDSFETRRFIYIRKEFIRGVTLETFLAQSGPLHEEIIMDIALKLCDILEYLHSMDSSPAIYRDLKPANIILSEDGELKLIDLDSIRQYKEDAENDTVYVGTDGFAPPEQYGFGQTDIRSDIYTFGATIYYLLTLKKPAADKLKFSNIKKIRKDVSISLGKIIEKCTTFHPDGRYQNMHQLQKDLMGISSKNFLLRFIYRFKLAYPKRAAYIFRGLILILPIIYLIFLRDKAEPLSPDFKSEQNNMVESKEYTGTATKTEEIKNQSEAEETVAQSKTDEIYTQIKVNIIEYKDYIGAYEPFFDLDKLQLDRRDILSLRLEKDGQIIPIQFDISDNKLIFLNTQSHKNLLDLDQEYTLDINSFDNVIYRIIFRPMLQELRETDGLRIYYVQAKPDKGFNFPYYLILPSEESIERNKDKRNYILVEPYYMGKYSDNLEIHTELAFKNAKINSSTIAEELGLPRLIPIFTVPESQYKRRDIYTQVLNRNTILLDKIMESMADDSNELFRKLNRIDLQLIEMTKDANLYLESNGWEMEDKIFLWGRGEAGQFANRFTFLHPDRVKAVVHQSLPILTIPSYEGIELPYPIGTADYKEITGRAFSLEEYNKVARLGFVFTYSNEEPLYQDSFKDYEDLANIQKLLQFEDYPGKWSFVKDLYVDKGVKAQVNIYDNDSMIESDSISFFEANRESDEPVYLSSNSPEYAKTVIFSEHTESVSGNLQNEKSVKKATVNEAFWTGTLPKTLPQEFIDFYSSVSFFSKYHGSTFLISIEEWDYSRDHRQMAERVYLYGGEMTLKAEGYEDVRVMVTDGSMTAQDAGYVYFVDVLDQEKLVSGVKYKLVDNTGNWTIKKGVTVEKPVRQ